VEGDCRVAIGEGRRQVRRSSVDREIACLDGCRIHRIGQVDNEIHGLRINETVARRGGGGHGKAHQFSIGKGVLLGGAEDRNAPVYP
jgi:hypothetical protein